jgi:RHS repeat-associated protein
MGGITAPGANQSYLYAPSGMRVTLTDTSDANRSRKFGYTSGGMLLTESTPSQWKRDVIYAGGRAIAEIDAEGIHELHTDHLGSPRVITAGSNGMTENGQPVLRGHVEGKQAFAPYGERITDPQWTNGYTPLTGFTGHVQQDATGLIYMRGRYYSPAWHRFLNSDQGVDPMSFNQFAYVAGSPLQATDPSGMIIVSYRPTGQCFDLVPTATGNWSDVAGLLTHTPGKGGYELIPVACPGTNNSTNNGSMLGSYDSNAFAGATGGAPQIQKTPSPNSCSAASSVFRQNRVLGGSNAVSNGLPISHTFIFTTDSNGKLLNTYSWGNNGFNGTWVKNNPSDTWAASQALYGNIVLNRVGEANIVNNIDRAFDVLRGISSEMHFNGFVTSNCKAEADGLIEMAGKFK